MKVHKIFITLLIILSFGCDLTGLLGKDDEGKDRLQTIIEGAERFLGDLVEEQVEYEYYYVDDQGNYFDEHGNVVVLNEDGTFVYKDKDVVIGAEGKGSISVNVDRDGKIDVSAVGEAMVVALDGAKKLVADVKAEVFGKPGEVQGDLVSNVSEVIAKGSDFKSLVAKLEGDVKGEIKQVVASPVVKTRKPVSVSTKQNTYKKPTNYSGHKVNYAPRTKVYCQSYTLRPGERATKVYISDDEKKMFNFLEKHLKDVIALIDKNSYSSGLKNRQDYKEKIKTKYEKLMGMSKEDTIAGDIRRWELGRSVKKFYDFIKDNAANSEEVKSLIESGVRDKSDILEKAGIKSSSDIKNYDHVAALIDLALCYKDYSSSIRVFFENVADTLWYYADSSDKSADTQDLIWKMEAKFHSSNSSDLAQLKRGILGQ
ncbi:hypothetical protein BDCR2A_01176 [Borrelia duttonii CR2A]|uniref:Lipoprotein n=1 Tax=Borrelia duttonii CR2A TaxID=1432657 RepID=W6TXV7_9SPIR|nr:hypothetical protein [Borrelia duttonii]ETZ17981.1 hypothetical protein BDCR2A_01176 [Borrelia duttonii CR2A]